jgi:hypothetical protein
MRSSVSTSATAAATREKDRGMPGEWLHTVKLLEDTVNGARATTAGHGDIELVGVGRHFCKCGFVEVEKLSGEEVCLLLLL